jgi:prolyl-tRNA editing enzyme YbaK/EbsC (Cys-tRNA(Pro) deacylase)
MLSPGAQKVQDVLNERGFAHLQVLELLASTRTAQEAADAVGCGVGQIVKSLIFRGASSGQPYLLLVSGSNRVNTRQLEERLGERLAKADAEYVRGITSFAIGGVPPVGHEQYLKTLIDPDLLQYQRVFAAAGTPFAVFELTPDELLVLTGGHVLQVT